MWSNRGFSKLVKTTKQRGTKCRGVFSTTSLNPLNVVKGHTRQVRVSEIRDGFIDEIPSLSVGNDVVCHQASSRFACKIDVGHHHLCSDVKIVENGADIGPSPKEICYSALGSCTVMTIRTFFENTKAIKGSSWANCHLTRISVTMDEVMGSNSHVPEGVNMVVQLEGNLSLLHKERLLRAADNCPVKKMMSGGLKISVAVAFDSDASKLEI
jgi:putative redox protein